MNPTAKIYISLPVWGFLVFRTKFKASVGGLKKNGRGEKLEVPSQSLREAELSANAGTTAGPLGTKPSCRWVPTADLSTCMVNPPNKRKRSKLRTGPNMRHTGLCHDFRRKILE